MSTRVLTFFYGSYMNPAVLAEVNVRPERFDVARLDGYDIRIAPRANLVTSAEHCVYGVLAALTHGELDRLYAHARDVLGEVYRPRAVLAQTADGGWRPALCFIADEMEARPAEQAYVARIVAPAREFGFPDWYIARLKASKDTSGGR